MTLSTASMKNESGRKSIKVLKNTVVNGARVYLGDVIEIDSSSARYLINTGAAEEYTPAPAKKKAVKRKKATKKTGAE